MAGFELGELHLVFLDVMEFVIRNVLPSPFHPLNVEALFTQTSVKIVELKDIRQQDDLWLSL